MEPGARRADGILHALWRSRFALLRFSFRVYSLYCIAGLGLNSFRSSLTKKFVVLPCNFTDAAGRERVFTHLFHPTGSLKFTDEPAVDSHLFSLDVTYKLSAS